MGMIADFEELNLPRLDEEQEDDENGKDDGIGKKMMEFFLDSRSIMIFEQIEPKVTKKVLSQLMFLNHKDSSKEIKIFINSPGGVADDGLAIYDLIKAIEAPVKNIVCGLAASAASIILLAADKKNRYALPNSRIMIHQPLGGVRGSVQDIQISAEQIRRLRKHLDTIIADETGQPFEKVAEDTNRDRWFLPAEAKEYGMISHIVKNLKEI